MMVEIQFFVSIVMCFSPVLNSGKSRKFLELSPRRLGLSESTSAWAESTLAWDESTSAWDESMSAAVHVTDRRKKSTK